MPDSSTLPPVKQTAAALRQQSVKTSSLSFLKKNANHRLHLNHDTTRSMPTSPSLSARAPISQKPAITSVPGPSDGRSTRLQALRTPLIHFLAARPASTKLLAQHLACKHEDVLEVLQKVGKEFRLDSTKWDLIDKVFKELDVWSFDYPNQEDRELAINRARSAFDRMRLSTQEKIWDKLLPKNERGQGKILSHLNLHKGPIQKSATPKIQIQHSSNESKSQDTGDLESDQKDRLAPSDAEPMARSKSHGPIKRTKISEKEAQSKRLLSNGPKKVTSDVKPKEAHPPAKKGGAPKKSAPKSSEFVNDSDEEDGLEDAASIQIPSDTLQSNNAMKRLPKPSTLKEPAASSPKVNGIVKEVKATAPPKPSVSGKTTSIKATSSSQNKPRSDGKPLASKTGKDSKDGKKPKAPTKLTEKKSPASGATTPAFKHRSSDTSPSSTAMKKTLSRSRTTSSPHKPSPLGSSPPTNASDLDNPGRSSTSSTPSFASARKNNGTPNGVGLGINGHARNTSEHTLKRKAGDLDSDIHNHGVSLTNGITNGYTDGHVNGNTSSGKRQKISEHSPHSDSSDELLAREVALKKAQDFKKYYANYEKQYQEISQMNDPPQEKVDELMRMHRRLEELKDQITRGLVGL